MYVTLQDAYRMLQEEEPLFTKDHLAHCMANQFEVLFTWGGVDFFIKI